MFTSPFISQLVYIPIVEILINCLQDANETVFAHILHLVWLATHRLVVDARLLGHFLLQHLHPLKVLFNPLDGHIGLHEREGDCNH